MGNDGGRVHEDVTLGAFAFGAVIGWVTGTTLQHLATHGISDIAAVVAAVGGAAVSKMFTRNDRTFGNYCLGLAAGFFFYLALYYINPGTAFHPQSLFPTPTPTPTP